MPNINPTGAAQRLLSIKTNTPAQCLVYADKVILQGATVLRHAGYALYEWEHTPSQHKDANAPKDFPVYFSGAGTYGDVAISLGNGTCVGIDTANGVYKKGVVGVQTFAQRAKQMGGKYLGWSDNFLGYQLVTTSTSGTGTVIPVPDLTINRENDMSIIYVSTSTSADGVIPNGVSFIQEGGGTLRPLSQNEFNAYEFYADPTKVNPPIPYRKAVWSGDMIRSLTKNVGVLQWSSIDAANNPILTGKIIFGDPTKADYPRTSNIAPVTVNVDVNALAKTLAPLLPTPLTRAELVSVLNKALAYTLVS